MRTPGLPVSFSAQGFTRSQPLDTDGRSTIGFLDRPDQERVLGAASFLLDAATGQILESDIYFNTRFRWSTAAAGEAGASTWSRSPCTNSGTCSAWAIRRSARPR